MHLVIVDPELSVPTHVFICATEGKESSKRKALELKQEVIFSRALGEELVISRSLFMLTTPTLYEVFVVKDRNEDNYEYTYRRSRAMKKLSEWLLHDKSVFSFDAAIISLDSEDLTITINVRPDSRVLIEGIDGYEEVKLDEEITKLFP